MDELIFEIVDSGNIVKIEPLEVIKYDSDLDWDKNWIKTKITVKGGPFSGQYYADMMTVDFEKFKQELSSLYDNLSGTANFENIEQALQLKIKGDGIGHFEVNVSAAANPGINSVDLNFSMAFDQTEIKNLINQLDKITKAFPIIGDFKIKNT